MITATNRSLHINTQVVEGSDKHGGIGCGGTTYQHHKRHRLHGNNITNTFLKAKEGGGAYS